MTTSAICSEGRRPVKKPELIVVALRFTPLAMKRGNQDFCVLDAEGVNLRPILLADACALERFRGIEAFRVIDKAEVEGAAQRAEGVVVRFLCPLRMCIGDFHELRVAHRQQRQGADARAPEGVEQLSVGCQRHRREIAAYHARRFVLEERIEDLGTSTGPQGERQLGAEAEVRKFLREPKRAGRNARLDPGQILASAAQILFGRGPRQRWPEGWTS